MTLRTQSPVRGGRLIALLGLLPLLALPLAAGESLYPQPMVLVTHEGSADAEGLRANDPSATFENREIRAHVPLPSTAVGDTRIGARIHGRHNLLRVDFAEDERISLYEISAPITLDQPFTDAWAARVIVTPSLAGDFESLNAKSIRGSIAGMLIHQWPDDGPTLSAGAIFLPALGDSQFLPIAHATWAPTPSVTLSAGVTYVPDTGRDGITPTFSVGLKPTDDLELMLSYPRSWIAYAVNPETTVYANVAPAGGRWRVADAPGVEDGGIVRLQGYRTGAGAAWALGGIRLMVEGGAVWNREYNAEPDDGDEVTSDIDETWYVMLGLGR